MDKSEHRLVVIGGGFGGLAVVRGLRRAHALVTLIDRRNFHLFQPLLYQVATGELSPANIASSLRSILRGERHCDGILADVIGFDTKKCEVVLQDGVVNYDTLVIASGATHSWQRSMGAACPGPEVNRRRDEDSPAVAVRV